ncbi:MAG: TGS domain-containing protein, partial [Terriglobales bacterium]
EEGIAAHWKYKDGGRGRGGAGAATVEDERLLWLRRLVEWQREIADPSEFLAMLKVDLAPEEIYAFTPKGQILTLGRDACVVDFAYAVHTEVGHRSVGARVNGRVVPLRYRLRTGDIVEVLTQPRHTPNRNWLSFVRTSRARQKIRHWFNVHERRRATEIGRQALERDARRFEVSLKALSIPALERAGAELGLGSVTEVYAAIGYGKISARQLLVKLVPPSERTPEQARRWQTQRRSPRPRPGSPILVRGFSDLLVYRAACCSPVHGEPIIGYISRGRGVGVHCLSCANVRNLLYEADRRIEVAWAPQPSAPSAVKLQVHADDNAGMLNAITNVISGQEGNIRDVGAKTRDGRAVIDLAVDVRDAAALEQILKGLKQLPGVSAVERLQGSLR